MKQIFIGLMLLLNAASAFSDAKMIAGSECAAQDPDDIGVFSSDVTGAIYNNIFPLSSEPKRVVCPMLNDFYGETSLDDVKIKVVHGISSAPIYCTVVVANPSVNSSKAVTLSSPGGSYRSVYTLDFPRIGNGQKNNNYVAYCDLDQGDGVFSVYYDE